MGAMQEEVQEIISNVQNIDQIEIGGRIYHTGLLNNVKVVVVFSRWGKVAAASTATTLIQHFNISELLFTGVAGAIDSSLKIGDIVIASELYQHDLDARPFFKKFEIPLLNVVGIRADEQSVSTAAEQLNHSLRSASINNFIPKEIQEKFRFDNPSIYTGIVASGDRFFDSDADKNDLSMHLPGVLCVEMEGAAVAQVCHEYKIPFLIIRTISDAANDAASNDFSSFIQHVAGPISRLIANSLIEQQRQ